MRERLALLNGTITIDGTAGNGTTVHASIPLDRALSAVAAGSA